MKDDFRKLIDRERAKIGNTAFANKANGKESSKQLVVHDANAVEPEPVEWLWPGRIAIGKTTLIGGDPGLGKSQLSIFIASTITQPGEWPCKEGRSPKRSVIMLSAEDGVADTIVPRLMAADADRDKVKIVTAVHQEDGTGRRIFNLTQDLDALEALITKLGDVGLVVIDPVDAYIGGNVDSHKNAAVRAVLEPISEMADRLGVAILALTHFSKQLGGKTIYRFIGSIAHIGAARVAFAVVADPDDKTRVLLLHAKNNLAPTQKGLAFRIEQHLVGNNNVVGSSIFFEPEYVTNVSADEALAVENSAGSVTAKDEAAEFLLDVLGKGRMKIQDIEAMARSAGLLRDNQQLRQAKPFRTARSELGVVFSRDGFGPGAPCYWSLPDTIGAHHKNRAPMDREGTYGDSGLHTCPQPPYAPSLGEGTYETEGAIHNKTAHSGNEGAFSGNGQSPPDPDIPACLDRRGEVCAHCGQAGGQEWDWLGLKVRLHSRCEGLWVEAQRHQPMSFGRNEPMVVMGSSL